MHTDDRRVPQAAYLLSLNPYLIFYGRTAVTNLTLPKVLKRVGWLPSGPACLLS